VWLMPKISWRTCSSRRNAPRRESCCLRVDARSLLRDGSVGISLVAA
jgi:hypothetical protein